MLLLLQCENVVYDAVSVLGHHVYEVITLTHNKLLIG